MSREESSNEKRKRENEKQHEEEHLKPSCLTSKASPESDSKKRKVDAQSSCEKVEVVFSSTACRNLIETVVQSLTAIEQGLQKIYAQIDQDVPKETILKQLGDEIRALQDIRARNLSSGSQFVDGEGDDEGGDSQLDVQTDGGEGAPSSSPLESLKSQAKK